MERSQTQRFVTLLLIALCLTSCSHDNEQELETVEQSSVAIDSTATEHDGVDTTIFTVTDTTITLRNNQFPAPSGRVVNVMVIGVDSRLGDYGAHADANHLVRFFLDSAKVEIISIPRDTYADAGFEDSTGLNKLTNVRAAKGRTAYLAAVSEITGVQPIHHWVEFGFSQAIGLLELLGYKTNAVSTLRVLRSRQAFRAGDFQRSYTQGRFIRDALLKNIPDGTDILHSLMLRAGIVMVETDMSYSVSAGLIDTMNAHGFNASPDRIWVRLEPPVLLNVQAFEFDPDNIVALDSQISQRVSHLLKDNGRITTSTYERELDTLLHKSDNAHSAAGVVRLLRRPYDQRAWLQVTNHARRIEYRDRLCGRLEQAYRTMGNHRQADNIHTYLEKERAALGY